MGLVCGWCGLGCVHVGSFVVDDMRDETIRAGDLVMVVRACCAIREGEWLGEIHEVRTIQTARIVICPDCKACHPYPTAHLLDVPLYGWIPLPWLKKIHPDPETVEHREEAEV